MKKFDPFLKQYMGVKYQQNPFGFLSISTATIDVRLPENTNIDYKYLFENFPVVPKEQQDLCGDIHWSPGTITGAKEGSRIRGKPPTPSKKALKNSAMIWIWLVDKWVNVKISRNNLHITGCKKLLHAAEAVRYVQQHIQLILMAKGVSPYEIFPYAMRFDNHMINYNFNLGVAISLPEFDLFIASQYSEQVFSSYDQNIHHTSMPLSYPSLEIKYTINDNGQISMCVSTSDIEEASENAKKGYDFFFQMLKAYFSTI